MKIRREAINGWMGRLYGVFLGELNEFALVWQINGHLVRKGCGKYSVMCEKFNWKLIWILKDET